ncbi:MAG: hypothetical protein A2W27_11025 [Deltaproteobacteria bacterium RBG_16_44_11]|nr:MAG: hypothetical protein A2W27_11025 [Deltaproteobacteria bacterium RBG_16_44_11]
MAYTLKELQELSDDQLISEHDALAQSTVMGINYYRDELNRRGQNRQTEAMLLYTRRLLWLTVFVAILTVVNVVAILIPLFREIP